MATPISSLRNLGPRVEEYMANVGIHSAEELQKIGYMAAYIKLRAHKPKIMNRMALYAIYGALTNQDCMRLPREIKDALEVELQAALAKQKITPQHPNTLPLHELP